MTRLIDMGVEPYLLSSSLLGVLAQRLVRKLCNTCKRRDERGRYHPVGCDECGRTGYKGRVGLYEVMEITEELRELIASLEAQRAICFSPSTAASRQ